MKGRFLFLFLCVFFFWLSYVEAVCENTFRRYAYGDADQLLFLRNFQEENILDTNVRFIVMQDQDTITTFIPLSIAEIMQKTDEGRLRVRTSELAVHEIAIEENGSFSFIVGSRKFNKWVKQGNPELKKIFDSLESTRKKISSRELNLPPRTQEESLLRARGYNKAYTRGLDEANEWIAVAQSLRDLNANAYTTHIEYFANKVFEHIEYIKTRLESLDLPDKKAAWDKLKTLEEQAEMRIKSESVTYSWWVKFNYDLVSLLGSELVSRYDIDAVLSFFPIGILMPTTLGELGVVTINKLISHGVDPVGVVNTYKYVDAVGKVSPQYFFLHDVGHAISGIMKRVRASYNNQLYDKLMEVVKNEPVEKRKNVEFAYFTLMHEVRKPYIDASPDEVGIYISRMFAQQIRTGVRFKGIIDFTNNVETDRAIKLTIDDFVETYSIAMKEAGRVIY